ncbi:hypothetical protein [Flavobacterium sp.]|uniref:hypothetical protein n=1 Tax=Flavobacterium sp. TaxID=239 RepID=UPI002609E952|nr:hypothetical protein [Flavobacterium sp.]
MRKLLLLTLVLFVSNLINSQNTISSEVKMKEKGENYLVVANDKMNENMIAEGDEAKQKAHEIFSQLVLEYPKSESYTYYLFTKGITSSNKTEARKCFEEVIRLNNWQYYTRKSYMNLVYDAIEEKDFENGLKYLEEIKKMNKPTFNCGVERETYEAQIKYLYQACETELKK